MILSSGRGVCEDIEYNGGGEVECSGRIVGAFYRSCGDGGLLIGTGLLCMPLVVIRRRLASWIREEPSTKWWMDIIH